MNLDSRWKSRYRGLVGGTKKNLSKESTRCRSCSKRCALSMMKRKGNEHVVSSNCSFLGLPVYKTGGWACDSDVSAVGRTSLPDVDSSGVAEAWGRVSRGRVGRAFSLEWCMHDAAHVFTMCRVRDCLSVPASMCFSCNTYSLKRYALWGLG